MKRLFLAAALALGAGLLPTCLSGAVVDGLVDDGTPRIAIAFADGRAKQYDNKLIQAFLRKGIPVTLAINAGNITDDCTDATNMCWTELRTLVERSGTWRSRGDRGEDEPMIEFANHGRTNFDSNDAFGMTWNQLWAEFDWQEYVDEGLPRPVVFAPPGDANPVAFMRRNKDAIRYILQQRGYKYATMLMGSADSSGSMTWAPTSRSLGTVTTMETLVNAGRPGIYKDPFDLPQAQTIDLGTFFVERESAVYGTPTATSPPSDWVFSDFTTNNPDSEAHWEYSFAYLYSRYLAFGLGGIWAMHDSTSSNTAADTSDEQPWVGTGTAQADSTESPGHFSPEHVAWVCQQLRDKGLAKFVTISEYCEWLLADYKPGTDLIANPNSYIPQFAIADTAGIELPWIQGCGAPGYGGAAWVAATISPYNGFDARSDSTAKFDEGADDPDEFIGAAIAGYLGQWKGIRLKDNTSRIRMHFAPLPPGRYRFSMAYNNEYTGIILQELAFAMAGRRWRPQDTWDAQGANVWDRTNAVIPLAYNDDTGESESTETYTTGQWTMLPIEFVVPRTPFTSVGGLTGWQTAQAAVLSGSTTWNPSSVDAGDHTSTTLTVTGAALGDPVNVSFSADLQELDLTGYVQAANTVEVVLANDNILVGTQTWDPDNLIDGAQDSTKVTLTGAALGDVVDASFSLDLGEGIISGYVSDTDTVTVILLNERGSDLNLSSGTVRVEVQGPAVDLGAGTLRAEVLDQGTTVTQEADFDTNLLWMQEWVGAMGLEFRVNDSGGGGVATMSWPQLIYLGEM